MLRNQLNGRSMIQGINAYALLVIRYPAEIISQPQEEVDATDNKTENNAQSSVRATVKEETQRVLNFSRRQTQPSG